MQIERGLEALSMQLGEELSGIGEEELVPGVAAPAEIFTGLIGPAGGFELLVVQVPAMSMTSTSSGTSFS